jgi:hypothetical protein
MASKVGKAQVRLPPLSPDREGMVSLGEECFVVTMERLMQLREEPVDVFSTYGKKLLQAAVRDAGNNQEVLQLSMADQSDGPHAMVHGVGSDNLSMTLFGQGYSQAYGSLEAQTEGGTLLLREGQPAMTLQVGFPADLRIMALSADGSFLASGGRYLGVSRGSEEVWKLKVCRGLDSLLIIACMLATILKHLPVKATQPQQQEMQTDSSTLVQQPTLLKIPTLAAELNSCSQEITAEGNPNADMVSVL